ncbi:MAG: DNA primase [Pseudomonadota bacterium]
MIPRDFIDQLLSRVDIVDVIDRRVPLKKAGQNYQACCPFHSEKTPSFTVSPTKQFYHCFGCGAHGSAIGFLMEYAGMSFVDAVKSLADEVGLKVPEDAGFQPRPRTGPDLTEFMARAAAFYKEQLKGSERAIAYLKKRGLTGRIAARFGLGYAPAQSTALKQVFPSYDAPELAAAGLVIDGEHGRYDRFRDRIMFPIRNPKGQVIAFGGRILDQGEPKYLNSPETPIFHKGSEVYGLFEGRQAIREAGKVLVVEGYMDVVALAQYGIHYAVATLGTATTPIHARTLLRQTDKLYYCFDGDNAGRRAAWRALENTLEALSDGKEVFFLFLPEGEDPDTWVRAHGKEAFEAFMQREAVPLSGFLVRELSREADLSTQEGRAKLLKNASPLLQKTAAPLLAALIRRQLGETLNMGGDEVAALTGTRRTFGTKTAQPRPAARVRPSLCRTLARALLAKPAFSGRIDPARLPADDPHAPLLARLVEWLNAFETPPSPAAMLEDPGALSLPELGELQGEAQMLEQKGSWDPEAELTGGMARIEALWARRRREELARRFDTLNAAEREELLSLGKT